MSFLKDHPTDPKDDERRQKFVPVTRSPALINLLPLLENAKKEAKTATKATTPPERATDDTSSAKSLMNVKHGRTVTDNPQTSAEKKKNIKDHPVPKVDERRQRFVPATRSRASINLPAVIAKAKQEAKTSATPTSDKSKEDTSPATSMLKIELSPTVTDHPKTSPEKKTNTFKESPIPKIDERRHKFIPVTRSPASVNLPALLAKAEKEAKTSAKATPTSDKAKEDTSPAKSMVKVEREQAINDNPKTTTKDKMIRFKEDDILKAEERSWQCALNHLNSVSTDVSAPLNRAGKEDEKTKPSSKKDVPFKIDIRKVELRMRESFLLNLNLNLANWPPKVPSPQDLTYNHNIVKENDSQNVNKPRNGEINKCLQALQTKVECGLTMTDDPKTSTKKKMDAFKVTDSHNAEEKRQTTIPSSDNHSSTNVPAPLDKTDKKIEQPKVSSKQNLTNTHNIMMGNDSQKNNNVRNPEIDNSLEALQTRVERGPTTTDLPKKSDKKEDTLKLMDSHNADKKSKKKILSSHDSGSSNVPAPLAKAEKEFETSKASTRHHLTRAHNITVKEKDSQKIKDLKKSEKNKNLKALQASVERGPKTTDLSKKIDKKDTFQRTDSNTEKKNKKKILSSLDSGSASAPAPLAKKEKEFETSEVSTKQNVTSANNIVKGKDSQKIKNLKNSEKNKRLEALPTRVERGPTNTDLPKKSDKKDTFQRTDGQKVVEKMQPSFLSKYYLVPAKVSASPAKTEKTAGIANISSEQNITSNKNTVKAKTSQKQKNKKNINQRLEALEDKACDYEKRIHDLEKTVSSLRTSVRRLQ